MLRMAIMGDLHYHMVGDLPEETALIRDRFYKEYLNLFLSIESDFHISVGDLVDEGVLEEFQEVYHLIQRECVSFVQVLGNHDVRASSRQEVLNFLNQPAYRSLETKEAYLIFLDTTKELSPDDWGGTIDEVQLLWLEKQMELSGNKPVLVFAHHPVPNTTTFSEMDKMSVDPKIRFWNILKKKKGIGLYFNGHNHVHNITQREQWHFVQTAAVLCAPSLRLVEINHDYIHISTLTFDNETLKDAGKSIRHYLPEFQESKDVEEKDQHRIIAIPFI